MKYLLSLLLFLPNITYSQNLTSKSIACASFLEIIRILTSEEYKEIPIWRGGPDDNGNKIVLFFNRSTTSYTIVEYKNDTGCILAGGNKSQLSKPLEERLR